MALARTCPAPAADPAAEHRLRLHRPPSGPRPARAIRRAHRRAVRGSSAPRWTSSCRFGDPTKEPVERSAQPPRHRSRASELPQRSCGRSRVGSAGATVSRRSSSARAAIVCFPGSSRSAFPRVAMGFGEGRSLLLGQRNPSQREPRADHRARRSSPTRRPTAPTSPTRSDGAMARDLRAAARTRQRALHPLEQPQGRPRLRVRHRRQGRRPHRGRRRRHRRPLHHQRDRRGHGPERRPGRRQERDRLRGRDGPVVRDRLR